MSGTMLDIGPLIAWAVGLGALLSFGTSIWNIFGASSKQNAARLAAMEARFSVQEREVQRIADKLIEMPDTKMLHRLELAMSRMEGHIDKLDERLKPVTAIAERMQDLLIEQGRK